MDYQDKIVALKELIENLPETGRNEIESRYGVNLDDVDSSAAKLVEHFDEAAEQIVEIKNRALRRIEAGSGLSDGE